MKTVLHGTGFCLSVHKAKGLLLLGVLAGAISGIAQAQSNILIVAGTTVNAQTAAGVLNTELTTAGNTVTVVNTGVPADIITPAYTQIYDTRYDNNPSLSAGEQSQYLAYLNAAPGNTLVLVGENASLNARNTPINNFISLAGGGSIAVPAANSSNSEIVNVPFTGPNSIANITYSVCGVVTSAGTGAFASTETGGGCSLYFGLGTLQNAPQGALFVVYDINFILTAPSGGSAVNEVPFRLNLEQLASAPTTPPVVTSISPSSGFTSGGTPVTITGVGFTGATGVTIGGAAATSVTVVNDTTITATTPAGTSGSVNVVVSTASGLNGTNTLYTYVGNPPPFAMYSLLPVSLNVVQNGAQIVSGTASVVATQNAAWQATTTTPWLTLNSAAGSFPGVVSMTANAAGMTIGTYNGTIAVTSSGQTLTVPVTLTVLAPLSLTADPASISLAAQYMASSATGYDFQIGPAGTPFTAQTSATSSGWLSVSPASGVAPATVHVVIDPSQAAQGIYQDSLVITSPGAPNSPLAIPVTMAVSGFIPTLPQQVNFATGAGPDHTVAPNEMVSLFLPDFSCDSQPVVSINGAPVAWSSYAPGQISYGVPASVAQQSTVSVACDGATAWTFNGLNVAATIPGIITAGAGQPSVLSSGSNNAANTTSQALAVNGDGTSNSAGNAASSGTYVSVYVTGFGIFDPASADGLRRLDGTVTAQIGGLDATVEYAGEAPGNPDAIQQINLMVPAGSPTGAAVPIMLCVNGVPTQTTATIAVQ